MQNVRAAVNDDRITYWVLPVAFLVHDAEELFTMPAWFVAHEWPITFAEVAVAIALFFALFVVITAGVWLRPASRAWRALYGGLLGVFMLHALTHVAQTAYFHAYTPGIVTAVLVVLPVSIYLAAALLRRRAIDLWPSVAASIAGMALFLPALAAAFWLSHRLLAWFYFA